MVQVRGPDSGHPTRRPQSWVLVESDREGLWGCYLSQVVALRPERVLWDQSGCKWISGGGSLVWPSQGQSSGLRPKSGRRDEVRDKERLRRRVFGWLSGQLVCIRPVVLGLTPPYFPLWFFSYAITVSNNDTIHVCYFGCLTWWGLPARLETVGFQQKQASLYKNYKWEVPTMTLSVPQLLILTL